MKNKVLTYNEFIAMAQENYTKGGEVFVECWDEQAFNVTVELFGEITVAKAKAMFKRGY